MNKTLHILALGTALLMGASLKAEPAPYAPGLDSIKISDSERPAKGVVWYPAAKGSKTKRVQSNGVWNGEEAATGAVPADGRFPLVMLSHGMYGNHRNQNWLASDLAEQGFIVVAIDHPGTSTFARDPDQARALWERPKDISRAITHMLERSEFAAQIDPERIYMAGHSLGGWTAVMLAGGRFDPARFDAHCEGGARNVACGVLEGWQVAKSEEDRLIIAQDYSDDRIKAFALLDLGGTQTFSEDSLGRISAPMLIIGAPLAGTSIELDVESRALAAALTGADPRYIEPAGFTHFDFMGVCTEKGLAILKEEEPDDAIVCMNGTEARRAKHAMVVQEVRAFFSE